MILLSLNVKSQWQRSQWSAPKFGTYLGGVGGVAKIYGIYGIYGVKPLNIRFQINVSCFRLGIFDEKDLHTIIEIMTEGGAEALEDLEETLNY